MTSHCPDSVLYMLKNRIINPGSLILQELLADGSFGVVYKALDNRHPPPLPRARRRLVAKKVTPPVSYAVKVQLHRSNSHKGKKQLGMENEARLHSMVSDHPNIVSFRDYVTDDDFAFMVMDYFPNGDLFNALSYEQLHGTQLVGNVKLVKSIFNQLLDAVEHCHTLGVFHRDLKPENILIKWEHAKLHIALTDFGLATDEATSSDGCGSLPYMSPECLEHCSSVVPQYDCAASDVWSLGIILFVLVFGNPPWSKADDSTAEFRAFSADPQRYFLRLHRAPVEFNNILSSMLTLSAAKRSKIPDIRAAFESVKSFVAQPKELEAVKRQIHEEAAEAANRKKQLVKGNSSDPCDLRPEGSRIETPNVADVETSINNEKKIASDSSSLSTKPADVPPLDSPPSFADVHEFPVPIDEEPFLQPVDSSPPGLGLEGMEYTSIAPISELSLPPIPPNDTHPTIVDLKGLESNPFVPIQDKAMPFAQHLVLHRERIARRRGPMNSPFSGHGPSPLRNVVSPTPSGPISRSSSVSSLSSSDSDEMPITPPMGVIDEGIFIANTDDPVEGIHVTWAEEALLPKLRQKDSSERTKGLYSNTQKPTSWLIESLFAVIPDEPEITPEDRFTGGASLARVSNRLRRERHHDILDL